MGDGERAASEDGQGQADERPGYRKLKDLRGLFSLSQNGIRLYERAGIISLPRNSQNNYRSATLTDAVKMCDAFDLTHYGIRLKDAGKLVSSGGVGEEIDALRSRADELDREIRELIDNKASLEERAYLLMQYERNPHACEVVDDADWWFVNLHDQEVTITDGYEDAVEWWRYAPLVCAGLIVSLDGEGNGISAMHGPMATGHDVARFHLPTGHAIRACTAGRKCLAAFVSFPMEQLPTRQTYAPAFDYARNRGLTLDATRVLHRLLRCHDEDGVAMRVDRVYFPLEEER